MPNDRDTHFLEFAKLLYEELAQNVVNTERKRFAEMEAFKQEQHTIIAQRAYDLVGHTLHELGFDEDVPFQDPTTPEDIPDLTQWPD